MSEGPDYESQFDPFLAYDIETRTQPLWTSVSSPVKTDNDNCFAELWWGLKLIIYLLNRTWSTANNQTALAVMFMVFVKILEMNLNVGCNDLINID